MILTELYFKYQAKNPVYITDNSFGTITPQKPGTRASRNGSTSYPIAVFPEIAANGIYYNENRPK